MKTKIERLKDQHDNKSIFNSGGFQRHNPSGAREKLHVASFKSQAIMNAQEYLEHWKQGEDATRLKSKSTDRATRRRRCYQCKANWARGGNRKGSALCQSCFECESYATNHYL